MSFVYGMRPIWTHTDHAASSLLAVNCRRILLKLLSAEAFLAKWSDLRCLPGKINDGQFYTLPNFRQNSPRGERAPRALWGLCAPGAGGHLPERRAVRPCRPQVQFLLTITHTMSAVVRPCGFPFGCLIFQSSYMMTLVILFLNFYIQVCLNANSQQQNMRLSASASRF